MIYEYRCNDCENQFEVWAKVADPAPEACPKCSSPKLEKVIFATNFALKGGGWYAGGYADSKKEAGKPSTVNNSGNGTSSSGETKTAGTAKSGETKTVKKDTVKKAES